MLALRPFAVKPCLASLLGVALLGVSGRVRDTGALREEEN